jgi:hypothetical protein
MVWKLTGSSFITFIGKRGRVIKDLFWITPEQICLGRRFVSGFMYETDATFNTNVLRLPLNVMVGVDNCGKTFPLAYCYITSESAASFKWIAELLTDLVFYDCPEPKVIVGDFPKGLGAAIAAKAALDNRLYSKGVTYLPNGTRSRAPGSRESRSRG